MCENADCARLLFLTLKNRSARTRNWVIVLPNEVVQFLSLDEVVAIHKRLIEKFGGTPGLGDKGLLESALFRPQTGYYEDLTQMSAALFESLLMNHPFVDGNKRVAFFSSDIFLRLNGWRIQVEADAGYSYIVGSLERGECHYENLARWILQHVRKMD